MDQERQNAFRLTCKEGNLFALKVLLDQGADVYSSDEFGRTALHWAVTSADTLCLEHLLERGFESRRCSDYEGMTPIMWAAYLDKINHLKVLLTSKRSLPNLKNKTINIDDVQDDGCDDAEDDADDVKDQYGRVWIHWCVHRSGDHLCLKEFLNKEVLKLKDNLGRTIVHVAAEKGSLEAMKLICSVGGNDIIEERDALDRTPLIIAAMGGHGELMNHLLSLGADILKVDKFGASAWDYARSNQLHYCMLILASYLRQSANQPPLDLSSSINFNQSLRLSLTHSRSIDRQDDAFRHDSEQQPATNIYPTSEFHGVPLQPRPPKTPSASPLGNFRRHRTPSNSETQEKNNPTTSKISPEDGEKPATYNNQDEGRTFPNSKDLRKKVKKSPKRHMFRREATMMVDSSSEEFSDKEQHIQKSHNPKVQSTSRAPHKKWNKKNIQLVPDVSEGHDEQSQRGYKNMQNLQEHSADYPPNSRQEKVYPAHNVPSDEMLLNKQIKPSNQRKVNFNLDSNFTDQKIVDISNLVSMENFAKWDVNFSNQPELENDPSRREINPWNRRPNDMLPNSPHNHLAILSAEINSNHPDRSDLTKKSAKAGSRFNQEKSVANEEVAKLKRNPIPAPRRLSRIDGDGDPNNTQGVVCEAKLNALVANFFNAT